jgi:hypothetical protein
MNIQCPFEYLACVQMPFAFGLPKDLKGATTYKHMQSLTRPLLKLTSKSMQSLYRFQITI